MSMTVMELQSAIEMHLREKDESAGSIITWLAGESRDRARRLSDIADRHAARVGADRPVSIASAPGRTELAGNHTDHNRGRVLCSAVALDVLGIVTPREDSTICIESVGYPELIEVNIQEVDVHPEERGTPAALVRGVAATFVAAGRPVSGFDATLTSDVAPGSGLSSSAAFEVFLGTVLAGLASTDDTHSRYEPDENDVIFIAQTGQRAENDYFGKPCGLMDQLACAHGGIISIDFADDPPHITPVDFDFTTAGYALAVVDTGGSHADLTDDYAAVPTEMKSVARVFGASTLSEVSESDFYARLPEVRGQCGDRATLRAMHFFRENRRVSAMIEALTAGSSEQYLRLVNESGDSSAMLLQNYYAPKAPDEQGISIGTHLARSLFEPLEVAGAARVHGGGFAGTVQVYVPLGQWDNFVSETERVFGEESVTRLRLRREGPRFLAL